MFLTSSFYAYLVPVVTPILIISFTIQFWEDKYNLFRRCSLSKRFNFTLTRYILKTFEACVFVYALGGLTFSYHIRKGNQLTSIGPDVGNLSIIQIVTFAIGFAYLLFLIVASIRIERKTFGSYQSEETNMYDDCVADGKFEETYWTSNPATHLVREEDVTGKKVVHNPSTFRTFVNKIRRR